MIAVEGDLENPSPEEIEAFCRVLRRAAVGVEKPPPFGKRARAYALLEAARLARQHRDAEIAEMVAINRAATIEAERLAHAPFSRKPR